jgi:hypothetical protein
MKKLALLVLIFAVGLGTGFYFWGLDNISYLSEQMKDVVERSPSAQAAPRREDVTVKPLTASEITAGIMGVWQSTDDATFTRTFSVDASVIDAYGGDEAATVEGRWAVLTAPQGEPPPFPIKPGTIYLRISSLEEVMYFKVVQVTESTMELLYLDGNGVQKFERKKGVR